MNKTELTISNKTILRIVGVVIVALLGLRAIAELRHPITLVLVAFFLAMALNPAVKWLSTHVMPKSKRSTATAAAFVSLIVVLVTFFSLVIPPLVSQVVDFVQTVPDKVQSLKTQDSPVGRFVRSQNIESQIDKFATDFSSRISVSPVLDTAERIGGSIVSIFAVLAMTFMMLNEGPRWVNFATALLPEKKRSHTKKLVSRMYSMVTGYVNGQLITSSIAAFFLFVMLVITSNVMNVSVNAAALAGIMFIFGLIPMIGNPIGAFIVFLACVLSSFNLALAMIVYFAIYAQIENLTLQPYIQSKQNELTPLTVFVAALFGVSFGGIVGALFAIPVAGCIRILALDQIERRGIRSR